MAAITTDPSSAAGIPSPFGSLPAAARVGKVRLAVSDLTASLDSYLDIVGAASAEECA